MLYSHPNTSSKQREVLPSYPQHTHRSQGSAPEPPSPLSITIQNKPDITLFKIPKITAPRKPMPTASLQRSMPAPRKPMYTAAPQRSIPAPRKPMCITAPPKIISKSKVQKPLKLKIKLTPDITQELHKLKLGSEEEPEVINLADSPPHPTDIDLMDIEKQLVEHGEVKEGAQELKHYYENMVKELGDLPETQENPEITLGSSDEEFSPPKPKKGTFFEHLEEVEQILEEMDAGLDITITQEEHDWIATQTDDALKGVADSTWEKATEKELRQELERVEARTQEVKEIISTIKTPRKITIQDYKSRKHNTKQNLPPKREMQNLPHKATPVAVLRVETEKAPVPRKTLLPTPKTAPRKVLLPTPVPQTEAQFYHQLKHNQDIKMDWIDMVDLTKEAPTSIPKTPLLPTPTPTLRHSEAPREPTRPKPSKELLKRLGPKPTTAKGQRCQRCSKRGHSPASCTNLAKKTLRILETVLGRQLPISNITAKDLQAVRQELRNSAMPRAQLEEIFEDLDNLRIRESE